MFTTLRASVLALSAIASIGVAALVGASTPAEAGSSLQRHPGAAFNRFDGAGSLQQHPGAAFNRFAGSNSILQQHPGGAFNQFAHPSPLLPQHPGPLNGGRHHPCRFGGCGPTDATAFAPASAGANCLKKQYTPDGQVMFTDICTNEVVVGPADQQAQAPAPVPQQR
jgi:hypothetical protein